jgi:hypothetical protein
VPDTLLTVGDGQFVDGVFVIDDVVEVWAYVDPVWLASFQWSAHLDCRVGGPEQRVGHSLDLGTEELELVDVVDALQVSAKQAVRGEDGNCAVSFVRTDVVRFLNNRCERGLCGGTGRWFRIGPSEFSHPVRFGSELLRPRRLNSHCLLYHHPGTRIPMEGVSREQVGFFEVWCCFGGGVGRAGDGPGFWCGR